MVLFCISRWAGQHTPTRKRLTLKILLYQNLPQNTSAIIPLGAPTQRDSCKSQNTYNSPGPTILQWHGIMSSVREIGTILRCKSRVLEVGMVVCRAYRLHGAPQSAPVIIYIIYTPLFLSGFNIQPALPFSQVHKWKTLQQVWH
jgi:hypothetical protein